MTSTDQRILLNLARESVEAAALGKPAPELSSDEILSRPGGAFVTLKISGHLRGCIGHFSGIGSLGATVRSMAREATLSDPRFIPVSPDEIKKITIEISVLSPMEIIDANDVLPGIHGLYIRRGSRAGTLLPQVAREEGWNRETFLKHTCLKAGLPPEAYLEKGTEILSYTAEVFSETTIEKGI